MINELRPQDFEQGAHAMRLLWWARRVRILAVPRQSDDLLHAWAGGTENE